MATSCEWRTAELLERLQVGTHRGKGGVADQSIHGRMGLGTVCKGETLRMKNVLIESAGRKKKMLLGCGKLCIHRKIPIYIYIYILTAELG
jgi:hypothetical protein